MPLFALDSADAAGFLWRYRSSPSSFSTYLTFSLPRSFSAWRTTLRIWGAEALRFCFFKIDRALSFNGLCSVIPFNSSLYLPCHHNLEAYLTAYIEGTGLAADPKGPLFRTRPQNQNGHPHYPAL
jgi:hypothetical protein